MLVCVFVCFVYLMVSLTLYHPHLFDDHLLCVHGVTVSHEGGLNVEYTFDLFVCLAILELHQHQYISASDVAMIYSVTNAYV